MLLQDAVVLVGYSARRARKLSRGSTISSHVLLYWRSSVGCLLGTVRMLLARSA